MLVSGRVYFTAMKRQHLLNQCPLPCRWQVPLLLSQAWGPPQRSLKGLRKKTMPLRRMISQALVAMVGCSLLGFLLLSFGTMTSCFHARFDFNFTSFAWFCRSSTYEYTFEIPLHHDCPTLLPSVKKLTGGYRHQLLEQVHHLLSDLLPYRLETRPKQTFGSRVWFSDLIFFLQTFFWVILTDRACLTYA